LSLHPRILLPLAVTLGACGHPASRQECEEIFRRSAQIELQAQRVTDPGEVARRTAAAREAVGDELLAGCLGRRITDAAMACVRQAKSADALDACLK